MATHLEKWLSTWHDGQMPHAQKTFTLRPDPDEIQPATAVLHDRDATVTEYLRACLRWLNADPGAAMATLAEHWPPPRPSGARAWRSSRPAD